MVIPKGVWGSHGALVSEGTGSPGIERFFLGPPAADPGTQEHLNGQSQAQIQIQKPNSDKNANSVAAFLQHMDAAWAWILALPRTSSVTWARGT